MQRPGSPAPFGALRLLLLCVLTMSVACQSLMAAGEVLDKQKLLAAKPGVTPVTVSTRNSSPGALRHRCWRRCAGPSLVTGALVDRLGRIRPRLSRANHFRILRAIWQHDPDEALGRLRVPTLAVLARSGTAQNEAKPRKWSMRVRSKSSNVRRSRSVHQR